MRFQIQLMPRAIMDLQELDKIVAARIVKKLRFFGSQENPMRFSEHLTDSKYGEYRFRIGDYRAMFDLNSRGVITILEILRIKHRSVAYNN